MAFSSAQVDADIHGTTVCQIYTLNFAGVTSGYVKTGLSKILFARLNNATTAGAGKVLINKASDGSTAEGGGLYMSGLTSNDVGEIIVFGR